MNIVITCAGSGGHINPGIAIADMLKEKYNCNILFIGTKNGLENDLVTKSGYEIKSIRTGKLIRKLTLKNISGLYNAFIGISDAKKILKEFKPDLVIGTGGYICVPVMYACNSLKIKYILHESNAYPGLSVKLLYKKSICTMVGFEDTKIRLKNRNNVVVTGTPTNVKIDNLNKYECRNDLKLGLEKRIVLITGGSQGARFLNNTVIEMVSNNLDNDIFYVLATGNNNYEMVKEKIDNICKEKNIDLYKYIRVEKYIYDMHKMYTAADLCIVRAGALTLNELVMTKKPSILIPLPTAAENHQYYNALVLQNINGGIIIEEKDLNSEILYKTIKEIDDDTLENMSNNLVKLQDNDINNKVLKTIEQHI